MAVFNRNKNPNNSESFLFKGLTKLLSGPITNYRRQSPRQLKRIQLDRFKFKSASGQPFKKSASSPLMQIYANARENANRAQRYIEFDQMEFVPEIAVSLDIYADEMTTSSPLQKLLTIQSPNEEIKEVLDNLYNNILNIDFNAFGICRNLCKYGDHFRYLDIDEKLGITGMIGLPTMEIERLEGQDKTNPNYVQFQWNSAGMTFENWQVAHFRILGNDKYAPYGTAVLDPIRRIHRQLDLQEQAMMTYRIVRAPERRVFYIDTGGMNEKDIEPHLQRLISDSKRSDIVDPITGQTDKRANHLSVEDDYYIPVVGNTSGTKIETLPGGSYVGDIDDVKYLRDKLMAGLKIPHSYVIGTEGAEENQTTLSQKDIRFARTIQRLQRSVISELEKIGYIHLFVLGYRGKDLLSFKLKLANPSKIADIQELEHWKTKFEVAGGATEGYFSRRWVAKTILNMTDEEFLKNTREMFFDAKLASDLEAIAAIPGDLGAGGEDLAASPEDAGEEESTLLAAPGKEPPPELAPANRHNNITPILKNKPHITPGAKGKMYTPVEYDSRGSGARKRNLRSKYSDEMARNTTRNIFKGKSQMRSVGRGIFEEYENNYKEIISEEKDLYELLEDERQVIDNDRNIKLLIESLEKDSTWKEKIKKK